MSGVLGALSPHRRQEFRLKAVDPDDTGALTSEDKPQAKEALAVEVEALAKLQERLYAQDRWAVLLIDALCSLDLSFPQVSEDKKRELAAARLALERE